jgi:putative ABC transport system permease protein
LSLVSLIGTIELGLVYSLLAFGSYISFRILNIADLTVDGSFVLGAAVSAVLTFNEMPEMGILLAIVAGAIAGIITALLQTKMGIQPILSGILTMTGLYSINLMVMGGKANIPLLNKVNIFSFAENIIGGRAYKIYVLLIIIGIVFALLNWFFRTQLGLSVRATGDNEDMCRASSIDTDFVKIVGFAISNAIVALSGALVAQMQQSADVNMGLGMVVISFASIIIGSVIIKNKNITLGLLSVILGSVIYRFIIALILTTSFPPSYLKLISALVVITALSIPNIKAKMEVNKLRRGGARNA